MNPSSFFGWSAAGLMLLTFSCHDARWLRSLAICANVAFIAYGLAAKLHPVAALHLISLPINVYRLRCAVTAFKVARTASNTAREEAPVSLDVAPERIDKPQRGFLDCAGRSMMNPLFLDDTVDADKPSRRQKRRGDMARFRFPRRHGARLSRPRN